MIVSNINTNDSAVDMFQSFATSFGCTIDGDRFSFEGSSMAGTFVHCQLAASLAAFYFIRKNKQAVYILLQKSDVERYIIMFTYSSVPAHQTMHLKYGDITINKENATWKHAFLCSSHEDMLVTTPPGFESSNLIFLVDKKWVETYIGLEFAAKLHVNYLKLKSSAFDILPLTAETELLKDQIIGLIKIKAAKNEINTLSHKLLKDYFLSLQLILKGVQLTKLNEQDVTSLVGYMQKQPEGELIKPVTRKELGRRLGMSESKLGNLFKSIYGVSYSQYIIKKRMEWAANKIVAGELSVTNAGFALGYENLSQFSATFKKHIKLLPSELQRNSDIG